MSSADRDWVDRVSRSIRDHESTRALLRPAIPRYEILEQINRGGMGVIYRAWDPQLGREVALKVLLDSGGAEARERFLREAQLAARLVHPHIVPVYDSGEVMDQVFLAMQLIDGTSLDKAKLDLRASLGVLRDAARAVHYAHEQGVIHRDLKPSNLMVDRQGRVYVTDFGLARRSDAAAPLTLTGTIMGTPVYMPPEQARGLATDPRSDIYSLGATMYEMLSGRPPFHGQNELDILKKVLLDEPAFPRRHNRAIPRDVEAIILKAMDKKASRRYATAADLADDIQRFLDGEAVRAPTRGLFYRTRKKIFRHRWRVLAAASFVALLASTAVWGWAYLDARRKYQEALREPDIRLKKQKLQEAAKLISAARTELASIEEGERQASALIQDQLAKERSEKEERDLRLKELEEKARHREEIDQARQQGFDALRKKEVPEVLRQIGILRALRSSSANDLEEKLHEVQFDLGTEELQRLAGLADEPAFRERYALLSGSLYQTQRDRDARLARPCLTLGLALAERSRLKESIPWLDLAERSGMHDPVLYEKRGLAHVAGRAWDPAEADLRRFRERASSTAPTPARYADLWHHRAREARDKKDWARALIHLDEALRLDSAHAPSHHDKGIARFRGLQLTEPALEDLDQALQREPTLRPDPIYVEIGAAWARGIAEKTWRLDDAKAREQAWSAADRRLSLLIEKIDRDREPLFLERAGLRRRLGRLPDALEDARRLGDSVESCLARGRIHYLLAIQEKKKPDAALAEFDKAVARDAKDPRARYWRGVCARVLGAPRAAEDLQAACAAGLADACLQLARDCADRRDWAGALRHVEDALSRAAKLGEDDLIVLAGEPRALPCAEIAGAFKRDAHHARASAHFAQKNYEAAAESCDRAIELDPKHASSFYIRGYSRYQQQKFSPAVDDFTRVLAIRARDPDAMAGRAAARLSLRDFEGSVSDYTAALEAGPASPETHAGLGHALMALGKTGEAKIHYRKALDLAPADWPYRARLIEKLQEK